jgi:endonuclease-3
MVAASRAKASDRAALLKKLFPIIKKHYKVSIPKGDKPVLETMLYAICLEDSTVEEADLSFQRLFAEFPDLNEVRVSTVTEVERAFIGQTSSEWRAFRVISVLKFVFDKSYSFEFESLRKKTLDLATKQLAKIKDLSPFVRDYTLHEITGAHLIPIDPALARLLVWLGLAVPNQTQEQMGEMMKGAVRKAEVEAFVFTLRCLSADQKLHATFDPTKYQSPEGGYDTDTAVDRLEHLLKHGLEKPTKFTAAKKVAVAEKPVVAEKPLVADKGSKAAVADKASKPAIADKANKPAVADKASKPAVAEKASKPAVAEKASKPAVTDKVSKSGVTEKSSKPEPVPAAKGGVKKDLSTSKKEVAVEVDSAGAGGAAAVPSKGAVSKNAAKKSH